MGTVPPWGDKNVLELDRGGGCMTLGTDKMPLRYIHFKTEFDVMRISLLFLKSPLEE